MLGKRVRDIHSFAASGNAEAVLRELENEVPVDLRDDEDFTPLARAAMGDDSNIEVMHLLIDFGAEVNAEIERGKNRPIGLAACSGNIEKVKLLLEAGADINFRSKNGYTVLINSAYKLNSSPALLPMVKFLIDAGVDVDAESTYRESALSVTSRFGRFDVVRVLLDAGADPAPLGWTKLMQLVAIGTLDELDTFLLNDCDIHEHDGFGRFAWHLAILGGDLKKVRRLFELGFDLDDRASSGDTALSYAAAQGNVEILSWLIEAGADVDAKDDANATALMAASGSGQTACVEMLLKAGASAECKSDFNQTAIALAQNEETVRLLVEAGEEIGNVDTEMKRRLLGLVETEQLDIDKAQALAGCRRIFGRSNPELMEIPFWKAMVKSGWSAYQAQAEFGGRLLELPTWCFDRFGTSLTQLPDGRFVQIGGEHEDYYDENFCIYNEVLVHERSGIFQIFGYPEDVFPPTDFHTATFVSGYIYVVGSLGYQGNRKFGTTPVYRLNCHTWSMEQVKTKGDNPGWIYKHKCKLEADRFLIVSGGTVCTDRIGTEEHDDNSERFRLDLGNMSWGRT